jgi:hypothetical protein
MTRGFGEKKLNESVFIAGLRDYIVKWKNYYYRNLKEDPERNISIIQYQI